MNYLLGFVNEQLSVNYTDYIIMFSNCESEVDMMCDIYEIEYEL